MCIYLIAKEVAGAPRIPIIVKIPIISFSRAMGQEISWGQTSLKPIPVMVEIEVKWDIDEFAFNGGYVNLGERCDNTDGLGNIVCC